MDHKTFRQYVKVVTKRYHEAGKREKSKILDELCATAELNRSYATRLLNWGHSRNRGKPGRKSKYNEPGFRQVLIRFWCSSEYLCGKLLKIAIRKYLPHYREVYGALEPEHEQKLLSISPATIDRILRPSKAKRGLGATRRGNMLREEISIRTDYWSNICPGFMEGDSVAHCGGSLRGQFIYSLMFVDIATTWVETRAVWTLNGENTVEALRSIRDSVPFPIIAWDFDNGGEFINNVVVRYCTKEGIGLTRSRPYQKNDNAHVEQKNNSVVRQFMGHGRLDNPDLIPVMNDLYMREWCWYNNFFRPSFKLKEKTRIGSKYRRKYDTPMTPFDRVMESSAVSKEKKEQLQSLYASLNPFLLRKAMHAKLNKIQKLSKTTFNEWQEAQETTSLNLPI